MSNFAGIDLTNAGESLFMRGITGGFPLTITRIVLGDGLLAPNDNPLMFSDVINPVHNVDTVRTTLRSSNILQIEWDVGSTAFNQIVNIYEIGVFADDPLRGEILYAYGNDPGFHVTVQPGGGAVDLDRTMRVLIRVSRAAQVTFEINVLRNTLSAEVVTELPITGEDNVIYLIETAPDTYGQRMYIGGRWVNIGA